MISLVPHISVLLFVLLLSFEAGRCRFEEDISPENGGRVVSSFRERYVRKLTRTVWVLETQGPTIIIKPNETIEILEGGTVTLEWTYNLNGSPLLLARLILKENRITNIVDRITSGSTTVRPPYNGRVEANITDTFTTVTFLKLNRTDDAVYLFEVNNFNNDVASSTVDLQVQCK